MFSVASTAFYTFNVSWLQWKWESFCQRQFWDLLFALPRGYECLPGWTGSCNGYWLAIFLIILFMLYFGNRVPTSSLYLTEELLKIVISWKTAYFCNAAWEWVEPFEAFISGSGGRAAGAAPPLRSVRTAPARRCPQPQHHQASPGQRSGAACSSPSLQQRAGGSIPQPAGLGCFRPPPPSASSRPPLAASAAGRAGAGPWGDGRVVAVRGAALRALLRVARPHHAAHRPAAAAARRRPLPAQRESGPGVLGVCVCRGGGTGSCWVRWFGAAGTGNLSLGLLGSCHPALGAAELWSRSGLLKTRGSCHCHVGAGRPTATLISKNFCVAGFWITL